MDKDLKKEELIVSGRRFQRRANRRKVETVVDKLFFETSEFFLLSVSQKTDNIIDHRYLISAFFLILPSLLLFLNLFASQSRKPTSSASALSLSHLAIDGPSL